MTLHTFICPTHGDFSEFVPAAKMPCKKKCPACGRKCSKNFEAGRSRIIPDSLGYRFRAVSLAGMPMVESRSEVRRAMKAHDRKYGTRLEEA